MPKFITTDFQQCRKRKGCCIHVTEQDINVIIIFHKSMKKVIQDAVNKVLVTPFNKTVHYR